MLDREYDRPEWEKADHAAEQFEKCCRAPGEKMIAYLRNSNRASAVTSGCLTARPPQAAWGEGRPPLPWQPWGVAPGS